MLKIKDNVDLKEFEKENYNNVVEISRLKRKVEQLEKENIKQKEIIENLTTMTVCGDKKQIKNTAQYKLEQLENIRKEAIKLIEEDILGKKIENVDWNYDDCYYSDMPVERIKPLLNILKYNLSGDKDNIMEDKFTGTKVYYKGKKIWCMEYSDEEDKYKDSLKFLKNTLDQLLEENNNGRK